MSGSAVVWPLSDEILGIVADKLSAAGLSWAIAVPLLERAGVGPLKALMGATVRRIVELRSDLSPSHCLLGFVRSTWPMISTEKCVGVHLC